MEEAEVEQEDGEYSFLWEEESGKAATGKSSQHTWNEASACRQNTNDPFTLESLQGNVIHQNGFT
jgi:hypothetical protein